MSNERRHPDDVADPVVSEAYRELSDEGSPAHLDHEILNMARNAAKERHRNAMAWLRPAAWVATVGLCLAIVLEVADLPMQEQADFAVEAEKEQMPEADALPASSPPVEGVASGGEQRVAPQRSLMQKSESAARFESDRYTDKPQSETVVSGQRKDAPAAIEVEGLRDSERQFLREAEDRARMQVGSDEEAEVALMLSAPAVSLAQDAAVERYCDEEETADPNRWLECILALENRGMPEAAMLERELLQEVFPDMYAPAEIVEPRQNYPD